MKYSLYLLSVCMILSSCATMFNRTYTQVDIVPNGPCKIVFNGDTTNFAGPTTVFPKRSKDTISITAVTDSMAKNVTIASQRSFAFYLNALNYGIGLFADWNEPRSYTYPGTVNIDVTNKTNEYTIPAIYHKGDISLYGGIPWFNAYRVMVADSIYDDASGFGLSLGAEYYYHPRRYFAFYGTVTVRPGRKRGLDTIINSRYGDVTTSFLAATHNHRWSWFSLGYGIAFSQNEIEWKYYEQPFDPSNPIPVTDIEQHTTLGLIFDAQFYAYRTLSFGISYRPDIIRLAGSKTTIQDGNYIGLNMGWRIPLIRKN